MPPQRAFIPEHNLLVPLVEMGSYAARVHIIEDVGDRVEGGGRWRWTHARPKLQFRVNSVRNQKFTMFYGIVPATFAETGPVTLTVRVNGYVLGTMLCDQPGDRRFEKPVPPAWLSTEHAVIVEPHLDKLFVSERDGVKLGYTLHQMGFIQ